MKKFWIKQRDNPQLGTYFVPMGELSVTEARQHEKTLYGVNTMLGFDTEGAYRQRLQELRENGERINE